VSRLPHPIRSSAAGSMLVLVALTLGLLAPPAFGQTPGSISIRLAEGPSNRQDDPRARIYVVDHLHQGDRIERKVEVGNGTDQPVAIELYAAAASLKEGQFQFGDGRASNDLTKWTSISPSTLTIPARGTATATITVAVPGDALDGERYAVVWAQPPASGGTVPVVNRVGVRMYVSVGEGAEPTTDFRIDNLVAARDDDGNPVVRTTVTNTGGRAIDLSGELELTDGPGSLKAGPFPVQLGTTLAPGESAPATVKLDKDLPDGPWQATVRVTAGDVEHEAKATITFPSEAGTSAEPVVAESVKRQRRVLIPLATVLATGVFVGAGASAWQLRRRRRAALVV
jgi:hypothetical protein